MTERASVGSRLPTDPDAIDPLGFARQVRRLAIDAQRTLAYSDASIEELTCLKHRSKGLLHQIQVPRTIGSVRWLCVVDRAIDISLRNREKVSPRMCQAKLESGLVITCMADDPLIRRRR